MKRFFRHLFSREDPRSLPSRPLSASTRLTLLVDSGLLSHHTPLGRCSFANLNRYSLNESYAFLLPWSERHGPGVEDAGHVTDLGLSETDILLQDLC